MLHEALGNGGEEVTKASRPVLVLLDQIANLFYEELNITTA